MWHHTYGDALRRGDDLRADADRYRIGEDARRARASRRQPSNGAVTLIRRTAARASLTMANAAFRLAVIFDASVARDEAAGRPSAHRS